MRPIAMNGKPYQPYVHERKYKTDARICHSLICRREPCRESRLHLGVADASEYVFPSFGV